MKDIYRANSMSAVGAVSTGTGVIAGAFGLTRQVAELAGKLLPPASSIGVESFQSRSRGHDNTYRN